MVESGSIRLFYFFYIFMNSFDFSVLDMDRVCEHCLYMIAYVELHGEPNRVALEPQSVKIKKYSVHIL